MPENTVSVTRPGKWGNPFSVGKTSKDDLAFSVQIYWRWLREIQSEQPEKFKALIEPLKGKNLACWCAIGEPCHADALLFFAK